jgi:hypothetical protein
MHVAASVGYYELVKIGGGDSALYYYDELGLFKNGFGLNTAFITYVVQLAKNAFGGTYLDYFLVFQSIGFFGIALLMRTFDEIYEEVGLQQPMYTYFLLLMPGLHYWTAAIGKEAPIFLGLCITLWASISFKQRWIWLAMGMLLMLAIRPHIAVITAGAFAAAVLVDRNTRLAIRLPLLALSLAGMAFAAATVWSTFQIDVTNVDTYTDILSGTEAVAASESAGRTAVTGSYPIRLLSLLFRPFFFDAGGALGLIVSMENLVLLILMATIIVHLRTTTALTRMVPFVRYAIVSSAVITIVLALGYYNVGLGIRQKATMITPGILVAFVALQAVRQARRMAGAAEPLPAGNPSFGT